MFFRDWMTMELGGTEAFVNNPFQHVQETWSATEKEALGGVHRFRLGFGAEFVKDSFSSEHNRHVWAPRPPETSLQGLELRADVGKSIIEHSGECELTHTWQAPEDLAGLCCPQKAASVFCLFTRFFCSGGKRGSLCFQLWKSWVFWTLEVREIYYL